MPKDKFLTKLTEGQQKPQEKEAGNIIYEKHFIYIQICCHFCTLTKPTTHNICKNICFSHTLAQYSLLLFFRPLSNQ